MYISIKLKNLLPVAVLTVVICILIGVSIITLNESKSNTEKLVHWFEENGEVNRIDHEVSTLLFPVITLVMGQDFEHNDETRKTILAQVEIIKDVIADLKSQPFLTPEETQEIRGISQLVDRANELAIQTTILNLPVERGKGMKLLHELVNENINPLHSQLRGWYEEDMERIHSNKASVMEQIRTYFVFISGLSVVTLLMLFYAGWSNNRNIVAPILKIAEYSTLLAKGDLKQELKIHSRDEIGRLAGDITHMAHSLDKLTTQLNDVARTDTLTGLNNRRAMEEALEQHISTSDRYDFALTAIMFDIDHFKSINDKYGHNAGDQVLKTVAKITRECVRDCDLAFRYGGEEFLIVLPNTMKNDRWIVAERIRQALLDQSIELDGSQIKISASFGIACFPEDGISQEELLRNADNALYQAKKQGRNRTIYYEKPLLI